jgi:hypothetical protein
MKSQLSTRLCGEACSKQKSKNKLHPIFIKVTVLILISLPTASLDEFASPTHTTAVQILFPKRNSYTGSSFDLVFSAPYYSEVKIYIDDFEVARVIGAKNIGKFTGLPEGKHR